MQLGAFVVVDQHLHLFGFGIERDNAFGAMGDDQAALPIHFHAIGAAAIVAGEVEEALILAIRRDFADMAAIDFDHPEIARGVEHRALQEALLPRALALRENLHQTGFERLRGRRRPGAKNQRQRAKRPKDVFHFDFHSHDLFLSVRRKR